MVKWSSVLPVLFCFGIAVGCETAKPQASNQPSEASDNSPVIVEINGAQERLAAFERFVKARLSDFYPQSLENQAEKDKLRSGLFDAFVLRQLVVHEARSKGMSASEDEVGRVIEEQRQQTRTEGSEPTPTTLASAERRAEIANDLLIMKYYQAEIIRNVIVTPAEIERNYQQNSAKYQQMNGFYVREIRVENEEAAAKVHLQALRKPDDFATLARQHSSAPSASNGGLMFYATQQLPAVLEDSITPLKVGSISKVVKSNYGFHIFRLEARAEPLPLERVRSQIEEEIVRTKNQALIDAYNERALTDARIKIFFDRLGFSYHGNLKAA